MSTHPSPTSIEIRTRDGGTQVFINGVRVTVEEGGLNTFINAPEDVNRVVLTLLPDQITFTNEDLYKT